ncbi:MAG: hypothetical protein JNL90_14485 [Planctomycetes bacterium]|nr:hypothetical protein [Planctomycetota bacterium]
MSARQRSRALIAAAALLLLAIGAAAIAWWSTRPRLEWPDRASTPAGATAAAPASAAPVAEPEAQREVEAPAASPTSALPESEVALPRKALLLTVVDFDDGRPLRGVAVDHRSEGSGPFAGPEREAAPLAAGDSPVRLDPPAATARLGELTVKVAGYESETLRIDWSRGGERRVALRPAGSLVVQVVDVPEGRHLAVRLFERERAIARLEWMLRNVEGTEAIAGTHWIERQRAAIGWLRRYGGNAALLARPEELLPQMSADRQADVDGDGRVRFDGLREGDWRIAVMTTDRRERAWVGVGDARIDRDREARAVVPYAEPTRRPNVALAGRLVVDRGWLAPGSPPLPTTFTLRSTEPSAAALGIGGERPIDLVPGDEPGVLRFDAGEWRPGEAAATFEEWPFALAFVVPDFPDRELELQVPPPADVMVQVRDLAGSPLPGACVRWRGVHDSRAREESAFPTVLSDRDGRVAFRAPVGEIELTVAREPAELNLFRSRHALAPGANAIELVAREAAAVDVTLLEGEAAVPWEWHHRFEASGSRGSIAQVGVLSPSGYRDPSIRLLLDGEGPAQLRAAEIDGYFPSEPVAVELVRGGVASVEIVLRRRN